VNTVGVLAAVIGGLAATAQVLLMWRQTRGAARTPEGPPTLDAERLEAWRGALRTAVVERRVQVQLGDMVRRGSALDLRVRQGHEPAGPVNRAPQVAAESWIDICAEWSRAPDCIAVVGEPGFGKTVSILLLLENVNQVSEPGATVAELFPLTEWLRWRASHDGERFDHWLGDQLASTYPWMTVEASRALIAAGLVLPLLDGLDELSASDRTACAAAIDAYAGRGASRRPFAVTCRSDEYRELGAGRLRIDRWVELIGLERAQIVAQIKLQASQQGGWEALLRRVEGGDRELLSLFRSPLRLALALEAYGEDASELLARPAAGVEGQLWEALLTRDRPRFRGASSERIQAWLSFLATAMLARGRQRLRLHELSSLVPGAESELRRFARRMRFIGRAAFVVVVAFLATAVHLAFHGSSDWFYEGVVGGGGLALFGVVFTLLPSLAGPRYERVKKLASWKVSSGRFRSELRSNVGGAGVVAGMAAFPGLLYGIAAGIYGGLTNGLLYFATFTILGLLAWVGLSAMNAWMDVSTELPEEPPARLTAQGPGAVVVTSRNEGLLAGLSGGLAIGLLLGLLQSFDEGGVAAGVNLGLVLGLPVGTLIALESGCWAWLYHLWLCRQMAKRGLLPAHLEEFLDWCALPAQDWLRVSDAYEFRHRGLMEHLASRSY
jgi:hypothetical protein